MGPGTGLVDPVLRATGDDVDLVGDIGDEHVAQVHRARHAVVDIGSRFGLRLARDSEIPVLTVCAGHAYPMGAFLMLSAEFVAWVLVLVYIGAVIVLFLFGIMITRAPTGFDEGLDSDRKAYPAALAIATFGLMAWASIDAFGTTLVATTGEATSTELLGKSPFVRRSILHTKSSHAAECNSISKRFAASPINAVKACCGCGGTIWSNGVAANCQRAWN